jgi:hypothetical protein
MLTLIDATKKLSSRFSECSDWSSLTSLLPSLADGLREFDSKVRAAVKSALDSQLSGSGRAMEVLKKNAPPQVRAHILSVVSLFFNRVVAMEQVKAFLPAYYDGGKIRVAAHVDGEAISVV